MPNEETEETPKEDVVILACASCGKPFSRKPGARGRPQTKCDSCKEARASSGGRKVTVKSPLDSLPPELMSMVAVLPLQLSGMIVSKATNGEVRLSFSEKSVANVTLAFAAWLASLEVELTPGWALLAAYSMALTDGAINAESAAKTEKKPEAKNGTETVDTTPQQSSGASDSAQPTG